MTSASCYTVLAYLCFIFYQQSDSKNCATSRCSLSCIALYFVVCCASFAVKSHSGRSTSLSLYSLFCFIGQPSKLLTAMYSLTTLLVNFSCRVVYSSYLIVAILSWICSSKINSEYSPHFSSMRFNWLVMLLYFLLY